jgi:hypothetical protein
MKRQIFIYVLVAFFSLACSNSEAQTSAPPSPDICLGQASIVNTFKTYQTDGTGEQISKVVFTCTIQVSTTDGQRVDSQLKTEVLVPANQVEGLVAVVRGSGIGIETAQTGGPPAIPVLKKIYGVDPNTGTQTDIWTNYLPASDPIPAAFGALPRPNYICPQQGSFKASEKLTYVIFTCSHDVAGASGEELKVKTPQQVHALTQLPTATGYQLAKSGLSLTAVYDSGENLVWSSVTD